MKKKTSCRSYWRLKRCEEGADILRLSSLSGVMLMVLKVLLQALGQYLLGTIHSEEVPFTLVLHGEHSWSTLVTEHVFIDTNSY